MCARAGIHQGRVSETCRLFENDVQWPYILDMANSHGLAPLLHRYLDACPYQDSAPPEIRQTLIKEYRSNAIRTLILIVHNGGKHQWGRLGWILDVAQLIGSCKQLDWEKATAIAARKGMSRALGLGLYLAQDLFSVELPESVSLRVKQDSAIKALAAGVYTRLFARSVTPPARLDHLMFSLNVRERAVDKIRYCLAQLFTSDLEDRQRLNLPRPLMPLYGLMRFARWLTS